jgi:hypothetical protein
MKNFQVSKNFSFFELTNTKDHPELLEANREYFKVQPFIGRLTVFAESMLEEIRFAVDAPVVVNSCGRCPALNLAVGGVPTSQHLFSTEYDGAADIRIPLCQNRGLGIGIFAFKIFNAGIRFYQMRVYVKSGFIHIGSCRDKNNGQIAFPESALPGWAK